MTPEELKEIEERCNKATPGPWRACHEGVCSCSQVWSQSVDVPVAEVARGEWGDPGFPYGEIPEKIAKSNSLFITHAREDIPKLLSYIKELESRIREHERICSLRVLANAMKKLCPDVVGELIKRVKEYDKKEDEKFSEMIAWLKGKDGKEE